MQLVGAVVILAGVVYALTHVLSNVIDTPPVVKNLIALAIGVAAVWLVGASDFGRYVGAQLTVDGHSLVITLTELNAYGKIVLGILIGSGAITTAQALKSIDNTDTARPAPLLGMAGKPKRPPKPQFVWDERTQSWQAVAGRSRVSASAGVAPPDLPPPARS